MKVLVTGGTGFVGREIVKRLHRDGHSLRLLARRPQSPQIQRITALTPVEVYPGDILQREPLDGAFEGVTAAVHLVGIISECGPSTFERIHAEGTAAIVRASERAGVRRFLHMSALGTRPQAVSRYHQSKWAAEQTVRNSALDFTIFRPSLIFGPEDHFANLFAQIARFSPVVPLIGRPNARFQPVAVETVADAFAKALETPASFGQTCDLCGPERLTLSEMIDAILAATGRKRWKFRVPPSLARCQAALLEWLCPKLPGKAPPLNRDQLLMLEEDNLGDPEPANRLFNLRQEGFSAGIRRFLK